MVDNLRARVAKAVHATICADGNLQTLHRAALLVDAVMDVLELQGPEPDLAEQMRHRKLGVYRLYWKSGGSSVAAVGMLYDGARWYAPANWTTGSVGADRANVVGTDWSGIERAELIEAYRNTARRYEPGAEDAL